MSVSLLIAGALIAQPVDGLAIRGDNAERVDVAYEELMAGNNESAVETIRASRLDAEGDPSALINLGTAYARLGQRDKALECYRGALSSSERHYVELADGSWVDSRKAARMAITALGDTPVLSQR